MSQNEIKGIITRIIGDKGFGFIKGTDGVEYFFHRQYYMGDFDDLVHDVNSGRKVDVTFSVVPSDRGPRASNVKLLP